MSRFRHLQIIGGVQAEEYRYPHKVRGAKFRSPPRDDELSHARALRGQLDAAQQQAVQLDGARPVPGLILTFESEPTFLLKSESLDDRRAAIRLLSVKTEGTKQLAKPRLNLDNIKEVPVSLPSLAEQTEIVRRVESLKKLADAIERRVALAQARADKLTQSILAKAFRGELVSQEHADHVAKGPSTVSGVQGTQKVPSRRSPT